MSQRPRDDGSSSSQQQDQVGDADGEARAYKVAHERAVSIRHSQLIDKHPHISMPQDFEHFLHVGAQNLGDVRVLCVDQQKTFESIAERRARKLPARPTQVMRDDPDQPSTPSSSTSAAKVRAGIALASEQSRSTSPSSGKSAPTMRRSVSSTSHSTSSSPSSARTSATNRLSTPVKGLRNLLNRNSHVGSDSSAYNGGSNAMQRQHQAEIFEKATEAVMGDNVEELHALIKREDLDINEVNYDGHTLLDVAVLVNSPGCIKFLMLCGGVEKESYADPESRKKNMEILLHAKQIATANIADDLMAGKTDHYALHAESKDAFEHYSKLYRRWHRVFQLAGRPSAPQRVSLAVETASSVTLTITEALDPGGAAITKNKIIWANNREFHNAQHLFIPATLSSVVLSNLKEGEPIFVRVASVNMTGAGPAIRSVPESVTPLSSRTNPPKYSVLQNELDDIRDTLEVAGLLDDQNSSSGSSSSRSSKFGAGIKLTKPSKKGLYLAACAYDETGENICSVSNTVPCVLIKRDITPQDIPTAIHFLQQLSFSWASAFAMDGLTSDVATLDLRRHVAEAVVALMTLLRVSDLGHLYYTPFQDEDTEATVLVAAFPLSSGPGSKIPSSFSWTHTSNIKTTHLQALVAAIPEIVAFSTGCTEPHEDGLYLACLFPHNTLGGLRYSVEKARANTLPCVKLRDDHFVSRDEWDNLKNAASQNAQGGALSHLIQQAAGPLLSSCGVEEYRHKKFRIYEEEVVDVGERVAVIFLVPDDEYVWDTQARAKPITKAHKDVSAKTLELLMVHRYNPSLSQAHAALALLASNTAMQLSYLARATMGDAKAELVQQLEVAKAADERLAAAWGDAKVLVEPTRWAKTQAHFGTMQLQTIFSSSSSTTSSSSVAGENDADLSGAGERAKLNASASKVAVDVTGSGTITVYSHVFEPRRHRLRVPLLTPTHAIVALLLKELRIQDTGNTGLYRQKAEIGFEKRLHDNFRPLLFRWRHEQKQETLVLKVE